MRLPLLASALCVMLPIQGSGRQQAPASHVPDPALAKQLSADERGMRSYILVILKTGPTPVPAGPARDEMFRGHFSNMKRLADDGKLAVAGPFADKGDWRGLYIFAVATPEEAETLVNTDPVVKNGEMVPEFHKLYATAALMAVPGIHEKIAPKSE